MLNFLLTTEYLTSSASSWYSWVRWVGNLGFWCVWTLWDTCPGKQSNFQNVKIWGQPSYELWCLRAWHSGWWKTWAGIGYKREHACWCFVQYSNLSALRRALTICFSHLRWGERVYLAANYIRYHERSNSLNCTEIIGSTISSLSSHS